MWKDICRDRVYQYLYEEIISHRLLPGTALVERNISNQLEVSRTPVREALHQLEHDGLVSHLPSKGAFVRVITVQDIEEIFELRKALEILALSKAIFNISPEEIQKMEHMLAALDNSNSKEEFYESDRAIHTMIIKNGGNLLLCGVINRLNAQTESFRRLSSSTTERLQKSRSEHREILQAMKRQEAARAALLLDRHIDNVKEATLLAFNSRRMS